MELNEFRPSKTAVTTFANSSVCFFYLSWPPMEIKQKIQQLNLEKISLSPFLKLSVIQPREGLGNAYIYSIRRI